MTAAVCPRKSRRAQQARAALWLSRLSQHDRAALGALYDACRKGECPRGVVGDWCEDHGGERGFVRLLTSKE